MKITTLKPVKKHSSDSKDFLFLLICVIIGIIGACAPIIDHCIDSMLNCIGVK